MQLLKTPQPYPSPYKKARGKIQLPASRYDHRKCNRYNTSLSFFKERDKG
jgi:hypothetical protein